jgi:hypothetical protein
MKSFELILHFLLLICFISTPTFALTLHCKFEDYIYDGNYKCEVENLRITTRNEIVSEVSGTHLARRTNSDVIILAIGDQTAHYLPKNLGQLFPNLLYLSINKSGLKEITKNELKDLPKLRNIVVIGNDIENLAGDLFEFNSQLAHIRFPTNKIKTIGKDIFKSLSNLESVNLIRNECINQQASNLPEIDKMMKDSESECSN